MHHTEQIPDFTIPELPEHDKAKDFEKHATTTPHNLRSYVDSQLSTSSESANTSPHSRRVSYHHDLPDSPFDFSDPNAKFPVLVQDKISKLKARLRASDDRNRDNITPEDPVTEEEEEYESENTFLKRIPVVADAEEFNRGHTGNRNSLRLRGRDQTLTQDFNNRCRSLESSFLPLDSVQEDKNEEEMNSFKRNRKHIEDINMEDLNEFNQKERTPSATKSKRKFSLQFTPQESILEEQETTPIPHLPTLFGPGSTHGSHHSSPTQRLKVDEIDLKEKKGWNKDNSDVDDIDMIMEEAEDKPGEAAQVVEDNREFQVAKQKLNEEKEFMKKVVMGELIDENNNVGLARMNSAERDYPYVGSQVMEEIIEEDKNENA